MKYRIQRSSFVDTLSGNIVERYSIQVRHFLIWWSTSYVFSTEKRAQEVLNNLHIVQNKG